MPKDRDPVFASLLEDTSSDSFLEIINPSSNQEIKMETLIPQELVEEFDKNFIDSFRVIEGENIKISASAAFFQENHTENSEKNLINKDPEQILKEHNYCNNTKKK